MSFAIQSVELPNGPELHYVEQGDPSGTPVVLLHGTTDSWRSFEPVLQHLPPSVHAFALTQRGHGDSGRPAQGYGPRDFAGDVAKLMDLLGIGSAVIAGHSMGASIARRFALDHPERTLGLVLLADLGCWRRNPGVVEFWTTAVSTLADPVDAGFVRAFQESTVTQPIPPGLLDTAVRESLKVPARVWRATFEAFLQDDFSEELGRIRAPALIVWGDADGLCPRAAQEDLLGAIAGSQLIVYQDAGHAMHWEEPARFAADLVAFTRTLSDRPAPRAASPIAPATA
jgi:non-heme chloroperoxidase